jgi:hypothetical protein
MPMALFNLKHNQEVARIIRDKHGVEMTPDQVDETRRKAFATIRRAMRAKGYEMPDDDEGMLILMRQMMNLPEDE